MLSLAGPIKYRLCLSSLANPSRSMAGFATNRIKANQGSDLPYSDKYEAAFALFGADPIPIRVIRVRAVAKGGLWRGW